jgi:hypothetical protein
MIDIPNWLTEALVIMAISGIILVLALRLLSCFKGEDDAN